MSPLEQRALLQQLYFTRHALEQGWTRCGLDEDGLRRAVKKSLRKGLHYEPGEAVRKHAAKADLCIAVDGPNGPGAAVCVRDNAQQVTVVTVRESLNCTQGERAGVPLTDRPFARLLQNRLVVNQ